MYIIIHRNVGKYLCKCMIFCILCILCRIFAFLASYMHRNAIGLPKTVDIVHNIHFHCEYVQRDISYCTVLQKIEDLCVMYFWCYV